MRYDDLPSPKIGQAGRHLLLATTRAISQIQISAANYPNGKHPHGTDLRAFFTACAAACDPFASGTVPVTPTLTALVFSTSFQIGTAVSGTISGATAGSVITCNVPGITVNSANRTYSGTPTGSASTTFGFTETLAGYTGSGSLQTVTVAAVGAAALATVTWTTPPTTAAAQFSVSATNWQSEDVLEFQLDTTNAFTNAVATTLGAVIGMPAIITADPLATGTYYARARVVRNGTAYAYSSVVTVTIAPPAHIALDSSTVPINSTTVRIDQ